MDSNKENENDGFNGTIYHEGFKFHRKYVGKKLRLIGVATIAKKVVNVKLNTRLIKKVRSSRPSVNIMSPAIISSLTQERLSVLFNRQIPKTMASNACLI